MVLVFPPRTEEEKYILLPFFWIPKDTIPIRVRRASVPYDVWRAQGYLMATEGNVVNYDFIEKFIEDWEPSIISWRLQWIDGTPPCLPST